jgi:predicted metal-dependent HD superfamily phosphohydrolase
MPNGHYETAMSIAKAVFARMSALYYHTPWHIMQMFKFAKAWRIELEPWEELAIWFHDSVYWPGTGFGYNEDASAELMWALLPPLDDIDGENGMKPTRYDMLVDRAANCIKATAQHLGEPHVMHYRVLDLDVSSFLATGQMLENINTCLKREMCPKTPNGDYDLHKWNEGRVKFLSKLTEKGYVFRNPEFKKFDTQAFANIQAEIKQCQKELDEEHSIVKGTHELA